MLWLKELLVAIGFDPPIVLGLAGTPRPPLDEIRDAMSKADCVFGLVAAGENAPDPKRMSEWVQFELNAAMHDKKPIGVLVDRQIQMPDVMRQAFTCCARHSNSSNPRLHFARRRLIESLSATHNHRIRLDRNHRTGQKPDDKLSVTR